MPMQQMLLGGGAAPGPDIADLFSANTWSGNGSNRSITTGLNMSGDGGFVWIKRTDSSEKHYLASTDTGTSIILHPNEGYGPENNTDSVTSFNNNGFSLGADSSGTRNGCVNKSGASYVGWSFKEHDKFMKMVTWTGNGNNSGQTITHGLGTTPAFIIARAYSQGGGWYVYHKEMGNSQYVRLNSANSRGYDSQWGVGATTFNASQAQTELNDNGQSYFAMVFGDESNGGTFGSSGDKKGIVVGHYTGNGNNNGPTVTLGFKPGFLMIKRKDGTGKWQIFHSVIALNYPTSGYNKTIECPGETGQTDEDRFEVSNTGFQIVHWNDAFNASGNKYIYMALPIST